MTTLPALFQPYQIGAMSFANRIVISPMCQYSAVNGAAVILDEIVTMETGKTYAIRFRKLPAAEGNDLSILRSVTTVIGEHDAVFVTGSGELPNVGDLLMFGESDSVTKEMIVREVEGAEDLARRFTLVDHAPQIESLADAEVPPAWTGRAGSEVAAFIPSLDFSDARNSQNMLRGFG